jgi:hypothetical protein
LEYNTYLRIYKATKAPHFLPRFIPDKLVLQEISYQTMIHGVGATLYRDKKAIWPPFPLWVRCIPLNMLKIPGQSGHTDILPLQRRNIQRHDPLNVVKKHCLSHKHRWEYTTDNWEEEEIHCCARTYHEVIFR